MKGYASKGRALVKANPKTAVGAGLGALATAGATYGYRNWAAGKPGAWDELAKPAPGHAAQAAKHTAEAAAEAGPGALDQAKAWFNNLSTLQKALLIGSGALATGAAGYGTYQALKAPKKQVQRRAPPPAEEAEVEQAQA